MGLDAMRPTYNFETKYRVTMLTMEDCIKGNVTHPMIKGHVWFTDGSRMRGGTGAGVYGQSVKSLRFSLGKYATTFQAEVYAILACVHEMKVHGIPEKHVSICSDSQAALKSLTAVRTKSPLVYQCQNALNDISALHTVGLYWVLDMLEQQATKLLMS
jgi:hypothetical protein